MGTCKLRAGDRRESVIGYRSTGAKASLRWGRAEQLPSRPSRCRSGPAGGPGRPTPSRPGGRGAGGPPYWGKNTPCEALERAAVRPGPCPGPGCPVLLGRRRMLRTAGAGEGGT